MIRFMASKDCYRKRGFKVDETEFKKSFCKCEVCALAKINKVVCHRSSERYSYEPGRFFYVDFSGPFEVSLQGNVYLVLFVDRASRLVVGFFVKNKDDDTAVGLIKRFIEENLSAPMFKGEDFVFLQADNGKFESEKVKKYAFKNGAFQRFSSPYHSLSNGPVETAIKKVKQTGRCILLEKRMPEYFWEYSAAMAIYIINRMPNRYEGVWQREAVYQMFGITADYSRFRGPFSKTHVLKRPTKMRKDRLRRGFKGILVGINDSTYKVWVPELRKVVDSSNVIIDESVPGELESGELYDAKKFDELLEARKKTYTAKDFEYLLGTTHIDNEDGLEYRVVTVREHRARKGKYIVVDRELVSGNGGDTVHALDVAAMTGTGGTAVCSCWSHPNSCEQAYRESGKRTANTSTANFIESCRDW
jgi:hypothetical protein